MDGFQNVLNKMNGSNNISSPELGQPFIELPYEYIRRWKDKPITFADSADVIINYADCGKIKVKSKSKSNGTIYEIRNFDKLLPELVSKYTFIILDITNSAMLPFYSKFYKEYSISYLITKDNLIESFGRVNSLDGIYDCIYAYKLNNVIVMVTSITQNNVKTLNNIVIESGADKACVVTRDIEYLKHFSGDVYELSTKRQKSKYGFYPSDKYRTAKGTIYEKVLGPVVFDRDSFFISNLSKDGPHLHQDGYFESRYSAVSDIYNLRSAKELFFSYMKSSVYIPKTIISTDKIFHSELFGEYVDGTIVDDSHPTHFKIKSNDISIREIIDDNYSMIWKFKEYETLEVERRGRGYKGTTIETVNIRECMNKFNIDESLFAGVCSLATEYIVDRFRSPSCSAKLVHKEVDGDNLIVVIDYSDTGD